MKRGDRPPSVSVPVLSNLSGAPSIEDLAYYAAQLANEGKLEVHYRVLSPETKVFLGKFDHMYEIPSRIFDESTDTYQKVIPSRDVEIIYSIPGSEVGLGS